MTVTMSRIMPFEVNNQELIDIGLPQLLDSTLIPENLLIMPQKALSLTYSDLCTVIVKTSWFV